jgi:putative ABC transport system permease protein
MRTWINDALGELTYAGRALARRPAYATVAAMTLAFGIGANVAIFSVVNAVLLRSLPYPDADRIVTVRHHAPGINMPELQSSPGLLQHYRESSRTLTTVAGYQMRSGNLTGDGHPERVRTLAVTSAFFDALAVHPALGRAFGRDEEQQGPPRVCILTDAIWRARFGADMNIVGRRVRLDGHPIEIVGVMPTGFAFPDAETPLLVPLWIDPQFGAFGMRTLARLAPGVSLAAAREEITALQRRIPERFPELTKDALDRFGWSVTLEPLRETVTGNIATPLWLLFGSVALVLLIAGANVANLFLVRAESRRREMALRAALGGSRTRVAWTFVAESLLLAAIGGFFGSLLATAGVRLLVAYGPPQLPRLKEIVVDPASLGFAAVVSLVAGLVLGLAAVPGLTRRSFADALRDGGRGNTASRQKHRARQLLIVGQVSMALVLLVGSGLMLRSIARVLAIDPGFTIGGLLTAGVSLGREPDRARIATFYDRVLAEVASLPGVTSVGASNSLPIEAGSLNGSSVAIQSRPIPQNQIPPVTMYQVITAGYFETLGMSLRAGRLPTRADAEPGRSVVWVNETFVRRLLGDRVIGERIQLADHWLDIVGVVNDVRTFGLREEIRPMAYLPLGTPVTSVTLDTMNLIIRTAAAPASLAPALRPALERVDASLPLTRIRTMDEIVSTSLAQASFTMTLLAIAAVVALVLGVVGLYGVISYVVSQRTQEIGVRLALGARPADVRSMVLRQGLSVALAGIVVGLAVAAAVTRVMRSLLFEISTRDPVTFAAVALILIGVSALATYLPARKASAIDPLEALRQEG